jgi:WD40 repeat protein/DNA-binding SARP family transcriptional activator
MARLLLSLLGPFQASLDGQPVQAFESNKVRALLALLALLASEPDRSYPRETLAGLLWPDYPNRSALNNLRSALANLRQAIGDPQADPPFLLITRNTIQFNAAGDYELDAEALRDLSRQPVEQLERAVAVYCGDFLEGFSLADSPPFEEWALAQREQFRLRVVDALHRLAAHHEQAAEYDRALAAARRALALEPWDEEAHRQAIRALALSGQRSRALAQYETCRQVLRQELGVEPSQETEVLAEAIRNETLHSAAPWLSDGQGALPELPAPGQPPFKGLDFYDEADADLFFGREALTTDLAARMQTLLAADHPGYRVLTVIGASGSGKSSIVLAGLIPALRPTFGDAVHIVTPTTRPLEALALSLTRATSSTAATIELLDALARDPRSLHLAAARLVQDGRQPRLLLAVDQFEELFTLCRDEEERRVYVDSLLYAARTPGPTAVIITLRADFYAQCAPYDDLRQALCEAQQYIGAMSTGELRQAIEEPARHGGWTFEPGLVDLLLHDAGEEPGALPLLSHALLETWRYRRGQTLTLTGYQATGGVRGAIARTAETTYRQLTPEQQAIARNIFLRLTELGSGNDGEDAPELYTRRRVALDELIPQHGDPNGVQLVLSRLADARLVTTAQDTVEVAHEALIREWDRLREWLRENRAGLRLHRQLTETAQEWERLGRDRSGLYRGARLAQAMEWATIHRPDLNLQEQAFLQASQADAQARQEAEAERQRRELLAAQTLAEEQRRRAEEQALAAGKLRRRAVVLSAAAVGLVVLLAAALLLGRARQAQAQLANSRELAAAAVTSLQADPERSVLLSLQAVAAADTLEARNALRQALPELHSALTIAAHEPGGSPGASYSPDGKLLASIGVDGTAKIWSADTGELVRSLSGDPDTVGYDIAFSPDGRLLAASWISQVLVWDVATGELRLRLPGQVVAGMATRLNFSPDSTRLAVANMDGQPKVWDLASGRELLALTGHAAPVEGIAFSPNGRRLATGDLAGVVKVWDAATGQEQTTLEHGGLVHGLEFSPDGRNLAAAAEDGRLVVWDMESGATVLSLPTRSGLYDVVYTPDGQRLATVHQDGTAVLWDAATGQQLLTFAGHVSTVISAAASPDNIHVATSGYDSTVRVWDTRPGHELLTVLAHRGPAYALAYSPDGSRLATAGADGAARLWDPETGLLALTLFPDVSSPGFSSIAFSQDGSKVAAGGVDGTVLVGDALSGQLEISLPAHTGMIWGLAFSPDGRRLASTSWDKTTREWDLETGEEIAAYAGHEEIAFSAVFSPDGRRIYSASYRHSRELDAATGEEMRRFHGDGLDVYGLALSHDGRVLAQGRSNGSVALFDTTTGEKIRELTGHGGLVNRLEFSQDDQHLATGGFDKFAKLWDVETGEELATFYGNGGNVFDVALSPDGRRLATAGGDGTARLYTLDLGELVEVAQDRVARTLTDEECQRYLHVETCP